MAMTIRKISTLGLGLSINITILSLQSFAKRTNQAIENSHCLLGFLPEDLILRILQVIKTRSNAELVFNLTCRTICDIKKTSEISF